MAKQEYTAAEVAEAIKKSKGILTSAATQLGCTRNTVVNYINRYPTVKVVYDETNETTIDFVESRLLKNIDNGDTTAMIFYLKCKAKARGYIDKIEVEHGGKGTDAINIRFIDYRSGLDGITETET